jgi:hypothetical protein
MNFINEMCRHHPKRNYLVGDWSKFVKTVQAELIRDAFEMIATHINWDEIQSGGGNVWPV